MYYFQHLEYKQQNDYFRSSKYNTPFLMLSHRRSDLGLRVSQRETTNWRLILKDLFLDHNLFPKDPFCRSHTMMTRKFDCTQ